MASIVSRKPRSRRQPIKQRPFLEGLESRLVLSTFKVNTLLDTVAVSLKTGKDATGHISLRSAIQAANSKANSDTILLPGGTIKITIPGANEDNAATGDFDIKGNLTIKGKGAASTIVDGNSLDRVFQVFSGKVQISGLDDSARHGEPARRRAIELRRQSVARFRCGHEQHRQGNRRTGWQRDRRRRGCRGPRWRGNQRGTALGGGISNEVGTLSLSKTTFLANQAIGGDGGLGGGGGSVRALPQLLVATAITASAARVARGRGGRRSRRWCI